MERESQTSEVAPERAEKKPRALLPLTDDRLWSAEDVARAFTVSESWVLKQARAGLLPYVKLGRLVRFQPTTIRKWLADREEAP